MAGFSNIKDDESIMFADNASFDGTERGGALTTNGQLWIGATALPHVRKNTLTAGTGVSIANGPGSITISASATTPLSFPTDSGTATPALNQLTIAGTHNVNTSGSGSTVTVAGNNAITLGDLSAIAANSNAMSATTGDVNVAAGNIKLPNTNAALTQGVIKWGSDIRVHNFGSDNIFMGNTAGNGTLTGTDNIGIGLNSLSALTSGGSNVGVGANCLRFLQSANNNCGFGIATMTAITTSSNNTGYGHNALNALQTGSGGNTAVGFEVAEQMTTGSFNTCVGYQAGRGYTGAESNNIVIGNGVLGTAAETGTTRIGGSQTACYIDGIDGVNVGSVATVVTEASDRLGTAVITAGSGITVTPGANTITIAAEDGGFTWNDVSGAFSPLKNNGYFITGTATGTLPASPSQGDTIQFFVDHATQVLTIDAPGTQIIRLGSLVSSAGGTATSTVQGDACELVYRASDTCWCAVGGFTGTWIMA